MSGKSVNAINLTEIGRLFVVIPRRFRFALERPLCVGSYYPADT